MNWLLIAILVSFGGFLVFEVAGIIRKGKGSDTFSEFIWFLRDRYFGGKLIYLYGASILGFLLWLWVHFTFQGN